MMGIGGVEGGLAESNGAYVCAIAPSNYSPDVNVPCASFSRFSIDRPATKRIKTRTLAQKI